MLKNKGVKTLEFNSENKKMKPKIIARFNLPYHTTEGRAYVHEYGLDSFKYEKDKAIKGAENHLLDVYNNLDSRIIGNKEKKLSFIIAILWGNNGERMIDFFGYEFVYPEQWPGNPEKYSWITRNGILVPETKDQSSHPYVKQIGCEDGSIILGKEAEYRRTTNSLFEYAHYPMPIQGLDLIEKELK